jgi:ABC-type transport system involved in Fe-S cluster assembly fused permease/ATPase subunit
MAVKKMNEDADISILLDQHKQELRQASEDAVRLIADAASLAAKVVLEAAAVAVKVVNAKDAEDHDLLIELKTIMDYVRSDIRDLTNGLSSKISELEKNKVDKKDFEDLKNEIHTVREDRVKKLEDGYAQVIILMNNVKNTNKWFIAAAGALFLALLYHIFGIGVH